MRYKMAAVAVLLVVGGATYNVLYNSVSKLPLLCAGEVDENNVKKTIEITVELQEYSWFVRLWSESEIDGSAWVEQPGFWVEYYEEIRELGSSWQILLDRMPAGNLSRISKRLDLKTPIGFFDGTCTEVTPLSQ